MNSIELAARFAAYSWFQNQPQNKTRSTGDAHRYADRNYGLYLDVALANRGVGRLLAQLIVAREHSRWAEGNSWNVLRSNTSELCRSK